MKMKGKLLIGLSAAVLSVGLYGCSKMGQSAKAVATVDGKPITVKQFKNQMSKMPSHIQSFIKTPEGEKRLLKSLVDSQIIINEALKEGLNKSKAYKNQMSNFRKSILIRLVLKKQLKKKVSVTDAEAKAFYEKHYLSAPRSKNVKPIPFPAVKAQIIMMLKQQKRAKILKSFVANLRKNAKVKYFYNNLPVTAESAAAPTVAAPPKASSAPKASAPVAAPSASAQSPAKAANKTGMPGKTADKKQP